MSRSSATSSATRITSATWTSRSAAPRRGITAIQMDIKIAGPRRDDPRAGARAGARRPPPHPRQDAGDAAAAARPSSVSTRRASRRSRCKPDQIRLIIGPGGKTIKGIVDQTGVAIDVEDDGTVNDRLGRMPTAVKQALDIIKGLTASPKSARSTRAPFKRITDFGAFVEISRTPRRSSTSPRSRTRASERVEDVLKEGDEIDVKVLSVERDGKIRLTRRELLPLPEGMEAPPEGGGGGGYGGGGGGDRGRSGGGDRGRSGGGDRGRGRGPR